MTLSYNCPGPWPAVQWPIICLLLMQHGGLMVSWELGGFVRALIIIHLFILFHFIYFFNSIFNKCKSKSLLDLSDHSNDLFVLKEWKDAFNQIIAFARIIRCATSLVIIYTKSSELRHYLMHHATFFYWLTLDLLKWVFIRVRLSRKVPAVSNR